MTTTAHTTTAGRFAPSVLDPKGVSFVDSFDAKTDEWGGPQEADFAWNAYRNSLAPEAQERGWCRCTMCGANLRYVNVVALDATDELFLVGDDCADNLSIAAEINRKVSDLRKRAEIGRENVKREARRAAYLEAHPEFAAVVEAYADRSFFIADVARKLGEYTLSDRQHDAVIRTAAKIAEGDARKAEEAELPTVPVVEGRGAITGVVLSTKWQESDFGGSLKMLVRDDRGFKVWGTVPSSLDVERDDRVTFTATVTKSDRDESFGFFKRPTKAEKLA